MGVERSLKVGIGARQCSWNPRAGTKPMGDWRMQIVPPVMMRRTLDSGISAMSAIFTLFLLYVCVCMVLVDVSSVQQSM